MLLLILLTFIPTNATAKTKSDTFHLAYNDSKKVKIGFDDNSDITWEWTSTFLVTFNIYEDDNLTSSIYQVITEDNDEESMVREEAGMLSFVWVSTEDDTDVDYTVTFTSQFNKLCCATVFALIVLLAIGATSWVIIKRRH